MKLLNILPVTLLLVAGISGCSSRNESKVSGAESPGADSLRMERVRVMTLDDQVIGKVIEYSSTLKANEEVHLVPSGPGRIDQIFVEVGSRVRKGDPLVQMDQTQLQQATIQLKNLETDFKRLDTLQKVGSVTRQQFDQISTQVEIARTNVGFLMENTRLKAPFDGVISGKYFEDGEMYSGAPNTGTGKAAILSIVQINPLKAMVSIPETYFPLVIQGMKTVISCDIYPGESYTGEIIRKYPTIDPATHSFQVEIRVANPGEKLRPGMFSRVVLELGEVQAMVVPSLAVLKMQGSNERYVFIEQQGAARRLSVDIGQRFDDQVEIISPELKQGDHLIIAGQARLIDGARVEVVTE